MKRKEGFSRYLFLSTILVVLGIIFTTVFKNIYGIMGIVFIAVGGVLFVIGITKKDKNH